ncbi:TPA: hypothetical protein ACPUOX_005790, partial [Klebsiella pneumoniae]
VGKMRDLILQLSKSSIYSTKPFADYHVLAEDNSVAVTREISEHCWDDSEERKEERCSDR